jgi:hypothetical protein
MSILDVAFLVLRTKLILGLSPEGQVTFNSFKSQPRLVSGLLGAGFVLGTLGVGGGGFVLGRVGGVGVGGVGFVLGTVGVVSDKLGEISGLD